MTERDDNKNKQYLNQWVSSWRLFLYVCLAYNSNMYGIVSGDSEINNITRAYNQGGKEFKKLLKFILCGMKHFKQIKILVGRI